MIGSSLAYAKFFILGTKVDLFSLQAVQNAAARLIVNVPKRSCVAPLLSQLHWLPVKQRIQFKTCCLTCKTVHSMAPSFVAKHISRYEPSRALRSSSANYLIMPRYGKERRGRQFLCVIDPYCGTRFLINFVLKLCANLLENI